MKASNRMISWFRTDPLPPTAHDPVTVIGGTNLIHLFMDSLVMRGNGGELGITVPFVDSGFIAACPAWQELIHRDIDLFVVVRRERDVKAAIVNLSPMPWRSLRIARFPSLHAKVFTFVGDNSMSMALVGSHNLTGAAARINYEAGVLISTLRSGETAATIGDLHEQSRRLLTNASLRLDTNRWPEFTLIQRN